MWALWHVGTGYFLDHHKDKGTLQRWARWWTESQRALGVTSPGFRVNRAPSQHKGEDR